jgi:hypothetical protein
VSNPIDHATPGLFHPLSVVSVLKTNFELLRGLIEVSTAMMTTNKMT